MELSNLRPAEGSKHSDNFRRGRGHGSGNGKTAGKGHKGQLARSGHKKPGFEGGQMPLYRRLPKRGFKNRNTKEIIAINVDVLNRFEDGAEVTAESLLAEIKAKGIKLEADNLEQLGRGNLIDTLYKKVSRPKLIKPTYLTKHPIDLSPLARANDDNKEITDRFQLVINGVEIVNGYSELVDPVEQEKRLHEQAMNKANGDEEAMDMIKYQQAYNLNSKMMSVMNQIYDKLINQTGI